MRRDLIRALNFPEDEKGRRRLCRHAPRDEGQAGQGADPGQPDVLTLLSQEGIYMDDLTPDRARPEIWRRFAQGERGRVHRAAGRHP